MGMAGKIILKIVLAKILIRLTTIIYVLVYNDEGEDK